MSSHALKMRELRELLNDSWIELKTGEFGKGYMMQLESFVKAQYDEHVCYPPHHLIFNALNFCPPEEIKVVIIGQDPYHGPHQAHGLSFSVPPGVKTPPSLRNIFKEVTANTGVEPENSGDLSRWAKQGVLLLNAILTVRAGEAGSHRRKGWETFTDEVIRYLSESRESLVFMLWGNYAISKGEIIDRSKHLVLESAHPSPLSAHNGFLGNKHFSGANEYLIQHGKSPIDWR